MLEIEILKVDVYNCLHSNGELEVEPLMFIVARCLQVVYRNYVYKWWVLTVSGCSINLLNR